MKKMKKVSIVLIALFFGITLNGYAQTTTTPADIFVGKWEIVIFGTPNGDSKMIAEITRKDGNLEGQLTSVEEPDTKLPITNIEEEGGKMTIYYSGGGYDLNIPFEKVDDDNLKGKLMDMFEVTGKRIK